MVGERLQGTGKGGRKDEGQNGGLLETAPLDLSAASSPWPTSGCGTFWGSVLPPWLLAVTACILHVGHDLPIFSPAWSASQRRHGDITALSAPPPHCSLDAA